MVSLLHTTLYKLERLELAVRCRWKTFGLDSTLTLSTCDLVRLGLKEQNIGSN